MEEKRRKTGQMHPYFLSFSLNRQENWGRIKAIEAKVRVVREVRGSPSFGVQTENCRRFSGIPGLGGWQTAAARATMAIWQPRLNLCLGI
jgi:hypothetical protein